MHEDVNDADDDDEDDDDTNDDCNDDANDDYDNDGGCNNITGKGRNTDRI
jgi:hypothetical protein